MKHSAKHLQIGELGEELACRFLVKHGFEVVERNYRQKWGEIDIIAKKAKKLHFVEVKSVSREINPIVIHETQEYRPEDNVHGFKQGRLAKTIETYIHERGVGFDFQIDVVTVFIDKKSKKAKIEILENVIFG